MVDRNVLGRGLETLLGTGGGEEIAQIPVDKLRRGKYQPRRVFEKEALAELADSIRKRGVLQPLLVRPVADEAGQFEIIAGERRWQAAVLAELATVPALVRPLDDAGAFSVALVENLQRENLNAIEEGRAFERLASEFGHSQDAIAQLVGKSRSYVANALRLLSLPEEVRKYIEEDRLTAGHGRALLAAERRAATELAKQAVEGNLTVRQTEKLAAEHSGKPKNPVAPMPDPAPAIAAAPPATRGESTLPPALSPDILVDHSESRVLSNSQLAVRRIQQIAEFMHERYGLRTRVESSRGQGRLSISWGGDTESAAVMEILCTMTKRLGFDPD
ncbi:hypothetical protein FACS1894186_4130 [Alphaproteobacteria bacterium]|nr:hypothetical protein FACS1894186_4130 [Alphaproteobacteria bacterium]